MPFDGVVTQRNVDIGTLVQADATSGTFMFISQPQTYLDNLAFRIKFALMFVAGVNMLVFQLITSRDAAKWDRDAAAPLAGRIAATLSLVFWIAIVFFGRRIGFTTMPV